MKYFNNIHLNTVKLAHWNLTNTFYKMFTVKCWNSPDLTLEAHKWRLELSYNSMTVRCDDDIEEVKLKYKRRYSYETAAAEWSAAVGCTTGQRRALTNDCFMYIPNGHMSIQNGRVYTN